jgi:PAS domain S-box-containing protein
VENALKILLIEDSENDAILLEHSLRCGGLRMARLERVDSLAGLGRALERESWDAILSDFVVPGCDVLDSLLLARERQPEVPFIVVSNMVGEETGSQVVRDGASDFVQKGNWDRLLNVIRREVETSSVRRAREQAEKALELAQFALEGAADAAYWVGPDGRFLYVNQAACQMLGYSRAELLQKSVPDIAPFMDRERWAAHWLELRALGSMTLQGEQSTKEGRLIPIEIRTNFLCSGDLEFSFAFVHDVTDRLRSEQELRETVARARESEERFRLMAENVSDGLCIREGGRLLYANARLSEIFGGLPAAAEPSERTGTGRSPGASPILEPGFSNPGPPALASGSGLPADLESTGDLGLAAPEERERVGSFLSELAANPERPMAIEFWIVTADGTRKFVSRRWSAEVGGRRYCCTTDLSEHRRLEQQYLQAQKMEAVGRLAGGVAHDFNNVLTVIQGCADLAMSGLAANDPLREDLEEILKAAQHAGGLTRQLLAFSRKSIISPQMLELNGVVREIERMLRRVVGEDVELRLGLGDSLWLTKADVGHLQQVLTNLAVNARDAMPRGGALSIATSNVTLDAAYAASHPEVAPGDYVMLSVSDTGEGMTPDVQARIFEPFFTTKKAGRGTGLGLATVYGIVKQAGGFVYVYSEVGQGTTFKIYLPRAGGCLAQPVEKPAAAAGLPDGRDRLILLVEDEELLRSMACRTLERCGFTVLEAANGGEALLMVRQRTGALDLVVTDVVMPRMNGHTLVQELRTLQPGLKALFMSGYTEDAIVDHGVLLEGLSFLHKPFTPAQLLDKVRSTLAGPAGAG